MTKGKLIAIAWKIQSYGEIIESKNAFVRLNTGVGDDFRGKPGKRQVTVVAHEAFNEACNDIGIKTDWKLRRANLLVEGINLQNTIGRQLKIGKVMLEITGETKPCHRMDEQVEGLKNAMQTQWRGGVCCRVTSEGEIAAGDEVMLL
jgi:MOSC domain-containing protein YiiM